MKQYSLLSPLHYEDIVKSGMWFIKSNISNTAVHEEMKYRRYKKPPVCQSRTFQTDKQQGFIWISAEHIFGY